MALICHARQGAGKGVQRTYVWPVTISNRAHAKTPTPGEASGSARERILNHSGSRKGSITDGVYNHYEYEAEKRAALELWADALDAILGSGPSEIDSYHMRLSRLKAGDKIKVG